VSLTNPELHIFVKDSGGKSNSERSDYNPSDKLNAGEPFDTETSPLIGNLMACFA
jgi:hypothetical protein